MRARHLAAQVSLLSILAGCATSPEIEESAQELPAPTAWKNRAGELASETADWRSFDDPTLAGYIEQALQNNPDAITAVESLNASRIGLEEAQAARGILYTVGAGASTRNTRDLDSFEVFDISGTASYEVDLWGRNRDGETLAQLDVTAAESAYLTTRISIAAEVADTYYAIRVADAQIELKLSALDYVLQQQKQIQARKDAGIITGVEVDRQEVEVQRLRFQIEDLKGSRSIQEDRLALLLGEQTAGIQPCGRYVDRPSDYAARTRSSGGGAGRKTRHSRGGSPPRGLDAEPRACTQGVLSNDYPDRFERFCIGLVKRPDRRPVLDVLDRSQPGSDVTRQRSTTSQC